ncbi:MAG: VOC family protein [Candidatus Eremiobacteraeota bacterium]|nr:VOC family protein [Candidatus Eremiobacteraeota bacterium]
MKTHLSFTTHDLDASVKFYSTLLNSEPLKRLDDYALFITDEPGLELALSPGSRGETSRGDHFGVAVDSTDRVQAAIDRLQRSGFAVEVERGETCCYAVQDKVWATDPDGRRWETYHVISESDERQSADMSCCRESDGAHACCSA